jgi:cytochrome P450
MTMRDIYAMATSAVGAGSDTTSCALQGFFYHMAAHPSVRKRVREEIEQAQQDGLCQDRVVSYGDAQKLTLLQACIKETLRIFSPVPMTLPRTAPRGGITIGDRYFPGGTVLSVNPWVIHHSKEIWGADAREFAPDRWLQANSSEMDKFFMPVSCDSSI